MQLCADGYEVTNLVSADPALRRRGFKLEYFLRPPVQVRLCFATPYLHIYSFRYYLCFSYEKLKDLYRLMWSLPRRPYLF